MPEQSVAAETGAHEQLRGYLQLARVLDQAFRVPGTSWRFGLDPLFGLIPGAGDAVAALVGVYGLWLARQVGAPASVVARMSLNLLVDVAVGSIPIAGDIFDFAFKANTRNRVLLESWLASPHKARRTSRLMLVALAGSVLALLAGITWLIVAGIRAIADFQGPAA